ncbi:oxidoreductase [Actinoplanes sp. SE50]|uniref:Gfo/Idh/MocA family protein n=1 Tax=unclassified Actinoplanes TaxID=2626549 RepID=UPI00023EE025|nr:MULTISPECIES: Gfo/Idh/MocA family oxidoreductase [unclassified Actinoplanes]AEV88391.1 Inositol 2-dehydrogenase/D-chiro-inositol 3-dehydrogenase [Actinoplanes sp. SE50/110]ATO86796.1 oxidoreductase [Actinoplanes sp. SE50]SLM04214.1 oxidoreductase [Actinoplanes sp. SE50/110]
MRFGLFGTGPWAHMVHAEALAQHPEVEFAGVWGRDPARAAELAGKHHTRAYAEVDALLADVDAVAIALPPDVQAPIALRAARAGRHLLLDKPVSLRTAEAVELTAAAADRDVASVVFFTRRFVPETERFLAEAVAAGGWTEARIDHLGSIFTPGNPFGASPWRRDRGGLWDVGPHALALVLPVLGAVAEVTGLSGPRDLTVLVLRHESGAISRLTLSVDAPAGATRQAAEFAGEAGVWPVPAVEFAAVDCFRAALDQLLAAAAGGPAAAVDVRFGAQVTAVLAAADQALEQGRVVRL